MSLNLTATTHILEVTTSSTSQLDVVVSGTNKTVAGVETNFSQQTTFTTATTSTICAAPSGTDTREIEDISITVVGAASQNVTVIKDVSATNFIIIPAYTLVLGQRLQYTSDRGWRLFDSKGRELAFTMAGYNLLKAPTLLTSGTTYTPSTNCAAILIELWGGGGAGGGAANPTAAQATVGSGGSCGGYVRKFIIGVPASIAYTIGAGGTGVSGAAGNAGGAATMTVNGTVYTATGGTGGTILATGTSVTETAVPAAVSGTNGDENITQASGHVGVRFSATQCKSGDGGEGEMGNNGASRVSQGVGGAAAGFNAGGGGAVAYNAGGAQTGGAGAPAAIRVWEFSA